MPDFVASTPNHKEVRWADPQQRGFRVVTASGDIWHVPNDPANGHCAEILAAGIVPLEYRRFETLEQAKTTLVADVEGVAARKRVAVVGTNDPAKIAVYQVKERLAQTLKDDPQTTKVDTALAYDALEKEAEARETTVDELADLILGKATAWKAVGLAIDAATARHKVAIAALADLDAAVVYDVNTGWPA